MYLKPSISNAEIKNIIKQNIKNKNPFCVSRIGDGEIYLLNNNAPQSLVERICRLWGVDISDYQNYRKKVCDQIHCAIDQSDILGIMDPNNELSKKMVIKPEIWSIRQKYLIENNIRIPVCCDHQFPRSKLFGDPNNLKDVFNGENINIVTPNTSLKVNKLQEILQCNVSVTLCTNNREELLKKIKDIKEYIVLYGVSITAKDLGVILKQDEKMALDFGATIDAWSGIVSRPWFKGEQNYCLI